MNDWISIDDAWPNISGNPFNVVRVYVWVFGSSLNHDGEGYSDIDCFGLINGKPSFVETSRKNLHAHVFETYEVTHWKPFLQMAGPTQ